MASCLLLCSSKDLKDTNDLSDILSDNWDDDGGDGDFQRDQQPLAEQRNGAGNGGPVEFVHGLFPSDEARHAEQLIGERPRVRRPLGAGPVASGVPACRAAISSGVSILRRRRATCSSPESCGEAGVPARSPARNSRARPCWPSPSRASTTAR